MKDSDKPDGSSLTTLAGVLLAVIIVIMLASYLGARPQDTKGTNPLGSPEFSNGGGTPQDTVKPGPNSSPTQQKAP